MWWLNIELILMLCEKLLSNHGELSSLKRLRSYKLNVSAIIIIVWRMICSNLALVGFPKCDTTSLFFYLEDHPEVCSSIGKENYFLIDKGHPQSLNPKPIILFFLRNLAERVYSLFQFSKNNMVLLPKSLTFPVFINKIKISENFFMNRSVLRNKIEHGKYIN